MFYLALCSKDNWFMEDTEATMVFNNQSTFQNCLSFISTRFNIKYTL